MFEAIVAIIILLASGLLLKRRSTIKAAELELIKDAILERLSIVAAEEHRSKEKYSFTTHEGLPALRIRNARHSKVVEHVIIWVVDRSEEFDYQFVNNDAFVWRKA